MAKKIRYQVAMQTAHGRTAYDVVMAASVDGAIEAIKSVLPNETQYVRFAARPMVYKAA